jgi:hypothetical protein
LEKISLLGYDAEIKVKPYSFFLFEYLVTLLNFQFKNTDSSLTIILPDKISLDKTGLSIAWTFKLKLKSV